MIGSPPACHAGGAYLAAVAVVALGVGCDYPVEPGSDLPDRSPPAFPSDASGDEDGTLDAQIVQGTDISGEFDIRGKLSSPLPDPVRVHFLGLFDQTGTIPEGTASVRVELRDPEQPGTEGPASDEPAEISESGMFDARVEELTIPASFSDLLVEEARADVDMEAAILEENCVTGTMTVLLRDVTIEGGTTLEMVELKGPFDGVRVGGECGGGGDAGVDASDAGEDVASNDSGPRDTTPGDTSGDALDSDGGARDTEDLGDGDVVDVAPDGAGDSSTTPTDVDSGEVSP